MRGKAGRGGRGVPFWMFNMNNNQATDAAIQAPIAGPAAWYRYNSGIAEAGSGVSQWSDMSGNGRHLLQATDAQRPHKQADGGILFSGDYGDPELLRATAFTLNQPVTIYALLKQITWTTVTATRVLFDGNTNGTAAVLQSATTPNLRAYAGALSTELPLTLNTYGRICVVFNGASSVFRIDDGADVTGNFGTANPGGFVLGAGGNNAGYSNIQAKEVLIYAAAHDSTQRNTVMSYLSTV